MPWPRSQPVTRRASSTVSVYTMPVPGSFGTVSTSHASRCAGTREVHDVEGEALAVERAAQHEQVVAELIDDVFDDAVVRGRGGAQHGTPRGSRSSTPVMRR